MVENLWNKTVNFLEGGLRPKGFNVMVGPSWLYKFNQIYADEESWGLLLKELAVEKRGDSKPGDYNPVRFMHTRHPLQRLYSAWADKFVIKNLTE